MNYSAQVGLLVSAGEVRGDVLANRGTPLERLAARREYLRRFPGSTAADFERALAQGTADARAGGEAVREIRREMMRSFLDGIPPAERGRFTETPILVLPDDEFVARTGSRSRGHAATLVVDGHPVVVLREGAPLSVLREEGMHARQIRDVLNADRAALLDERRLAQWGTTSLEDRVAAWHAKLDLELEVQQRLMTDLDAELTRPGVTAERAAALVDRFEDARSAFDVLSERRRLLGALDSDGLARVRSGEVVPPRFLADEPRLFSKSAAPEIEVLESGGRRRVAPEEREGSRRSRWVREWDADGNLVDMYLERLGARGWRRSGLVGTWGGGVGEVAMRLRNAEDARAAGPGVKRVQIDAQTSRGWGFDDVVTQFRRLTDGSVHADVTVYEAKNYTGGTVQEFSAIDKSFRANLQRLRDRLDDLLTAGTWEAAGLDEAEVRAALRAVDERRVRVEVRTSKSTRVAKDTLSDLESRLQREMGPGVTVTRGERITAEAMAAAEPWWETIERYRLGGTEGMDATDAQLFRTLAQRPNGISPQSIDTAELVVMARRTGLVAGDVRWDPSGGFLLDDAGPFVVHTPRRGADGRFDPDAAAREIVDRATRKVRPFRASVAAEATPRVVVDDGLLSRGEARALAESLTRARARRRVEAARTPTIPLSGRAR